MSYHVQNAEGDITNSVAYDSIIYALNAQTHATLALVEQQRIANLIALSNATEKHYLTEPIPDETIKRLQVERGDLDCMISTHQLRPEIAEALGIGDTE